MIQVFVKHKSIYVRELVQVGLRGSIQLDVGDKLHLIARPAFDRDCSTRRTNDCNRAAESEATCFTSRGRALQQSRWQRSSGFVLLLRNDRRWREQNDKQRGNHQ